jgi:diketogulonate reductase-like aldo/keto reductase
MACSRGKAVKRCYKTGIRQPVMSTAASRMFSLGLQVGQALDQAMQEGIVTREQLFITSKLW